MSKSKLYTKTGDKGETSLVSGNRISKNNKLLDVYGDVDELNSFIGLLLSTLSVDTQTKVLLQLQHNLFNLGSKLACEPELWEKYKLPDINANLIETLEKQIDELDEQLAPLTNFILPGGSSSASHAHLCRTITRRLERKMIGLETTPARSIEFINRLSDYFFVLARYLNKKDNMKDIVWDKNL